MGSGKSSVGRALAGRLGWKFVDIDDVVAARMGCSIAELWGSAGEEAFRDMEAAAIMAAAVGEGAVIATGGGAVLKQRNVDAMQKAGAVVWLQATPDTLELRIGSGAGRPLLRDDKVTGRSGSILESLSSILEEREEAYAAAATHRVATDGLTLSTVVERVEELWNAS